MAWLFNRADFTLTFRQLCVAAAGREGDGGVRALFADPDDYDSWASAWRRRLEEYASEIEVGPIPIVSNLQQSEPLIT
jgi:uncharacterized protein YdiU (UPF0061 family)